MHASLQRRLTAAAWVGVLASLLAMAVLFYFGTRHLLVRQMDASLEEEAHSVTGLVSFEHGVVEVDQDALEHDFENRPSAARLQIWAEDGSTLYRSPNLVGDLPPPALDDSDEPRFEWIPDSPEFRAVTLTFRARFDPGDESDPEGVDDDGRLSSTVPRVTLAMARSAAPLTRLLSRIILLLVVTGCSLAAVAAIAARSIVRRGVAPLARFAWAIERIDDRDLSSRLATEDLPAEILPVGERLNDLLARLDTAITKERSFSAAIAHELRTPIAALRSTIDVTLRQPRHADAYRAGLEECAQSLDRLQSLVERLLWLVRLDSGSVALEIGPVDCVSLVRSSRDSFAEMIRARRLRIVDELPAVLTVDADAVLLGIAIRNLVENAVAYADEGGTIRFCGEFERNLLEISNTGSRVASSEVSTLFDRFARGDDSRAATGSQCGLGLSIVRRIAKILSASIEIRTEVSGLFEVRLAFDRGDAGGKGAPRATGPRMGMDA